MFLPGEFQGQRSLVGYSPWGLKLEGYNLVRVSLNTTQRRESWQEWQVTGVTKKERLGRGNNFLQISYINKITIPPIQPFLACLFAYMLSSVHFRHLVVCDSLRPMDCSTPGFPVHHQLPTRSASSKLIFTW